MDIEERIEDIKNNPERHRHRHINDVIECSIVDGAIVITLVQAHEGTSKYGSRCDVEEGSCSCGGWHE